MCPHGVAERRGDAGDGVRELPIDGEIVRAAQVVVVDPGHTRAFQIDSLLGPSSTSPLRGAPFPHVVTWIRRRPRANAPTNVVHSPGRQDP